MKKIAALFLCFLGSGVLHALPLGNPAEPSFLTRGVFWGGACDNACDPCGFWFDNWGIKVGYYGDFVFDRKLKVRDANGDDIHNTQLFTNAGYFALNLANRLDIFGTVGVSRLRITQIEETWATTIAASRDSDGTLETNSDFSWSAGARAVLVKCCGFTLGVEGQYFQTRPKFNRYVSNFLTGTTVYFDDNNKVKYKEWQAGLGLAYSITCCDPCWQIVPYAGVKWAWVRVDPDHFAFNVTDLLILTRTLTLFDLREQVRLGYAAGVSLVAFGNTALTLEGRWISEKALYFNAQFRF